MSGNGIGSEPTMRNVRLACSSPPIDDATPHIQAKTEGHYGFSCEIWLEPNPGSAESTPASGSRRSDASGYTAKLRCRARKGPAD